LAPRSHTRARAWWLTCGPHWSALSPPRNRTLSTIALWPPFPFTGDLAEDLVVARCQVAGSIRPDRTLKLRAWCPFLSFLRTLTSAAFASSPCLRTSLAPPSSVVLWAQYCLPHSPATSVPVAATSAPYGVRHRGVEESCSRQRRPRMRPRLGFGHRSGSSLGRARRKLLGAGDPCYGRTDPTTACRLGQACPVL
jgi:hypothetical protein